MKSEKCFIFTGGSINAPNYYQDLLKDDGFILCVDSGARHALKFGIKPDLLIGDFDTLTEVELDMFRQAGVEIKHYPEDKDYTDTYLALQYALDRGFKEIIIIGALGSRIDHSLANILLLTLPATRKSNVRIITPFQEIFMVNGYVKIEGKVGDLISLIPLSEEVTGVKMSGLVYEVKDHIFRMDMPIGISNVFSSTVAEITVDKGLLLAIKSNSNFS